MLNLKYVHIHTHNSKGEENKKRAGSLSWRYNEAEYMLESSWRRRSLER